ncbi:hypothetical protein ACFE04_009213 [Oxalis oulophora]
MSSPRPLLLQSPKTPGRPAQDFAFSDSISFSKMGSKSPMESQSPFSIEPSRNSSSHRSLAQSRGSGGNSIKEVNFGDFGSTPVRHGSRGNDSEGFSMSMSQREINDEDARFVYINDVEKTNERFEFAGNSIRTAKYSIITFLPKNLFEQFHRVAYVYFLIIAILNQLPQLAVFGRTASVLPLAFVLAVTAIKDIYEDWRRATADKIENNRFASILVNNQFEQKKWKDIRVGEVIKVHADETLPCDIVLLSTSDPTGVVYVQTINLDGESNLKTRYAKQETLSKIPDKEHISGLVKCEKPNRNIYGFQATMDIDGKRLSLGPANIILRGCELKNTYWAIGVVVYAGRETKAMLNNSGAPSKRSRIESRMNFEMIMLSFFLVTLCTIVSACAGVWLRNNREKLVEIVFYHKKDFSEPKVDNYNYYGLALEIFFTFLMAVIVFQIMIPISLYISVELVRVGQAFFMTQDMQMYDEASDASFQCRALNINEDLGQVKYVFSDKTGTFTENKMEFQCASVWGVDYSNQRAGSSNELDGYFVQEYGQVFRPKMKVATDPELLQLLKSQIDTEQRNRVRDFFTALAACNTIVPIVLDTSDPNEKLIDYQGESPDEQALVYAAAAYGFMLIERTSGHIVVNVQGETLRLNVLGLHEFDSDRKRMSVILGFPDKNVRVFVKGADTAMYTLYTCFTLTTAINEWSSVLYSVIYTAVPTIVVAIIDKDLGRRTLLKHPQLYGAGHRDETYNKPLFWLTMIDTLWQSVVIFFVPLLAYWGSEIDGPGLGDLWTLATVIVVNLHLAMDVIEWNWITHNAIWGSIFATWICVIVIDAVPSLVGYWAIFNIAKQREFWLRLLGIVVGSLAPRFVIKVLSQYYCLSDIQIYKEVEKFGDDGLELEMNDFSEGREGRI